jgi:hypothetical protein
MDPRKEFTQDKVKPAVASTTNSTSTVPTSPSPPAGLHPGKRAIYHEKANKRVKLEVNYTSQYHAPRHHVHPSRLNLVEPRSNASRPAQTSSSPPETFGDIQLRDEVPLLQRTGSNTVPLGNVLKRKVMHSSGTDSAARRDSDVSRSSRALCANGLEGTGTNETLRETVRRQWRHSSLTYEQLLENRRTEHLGSKVDRYVPSSESRISYGAAASPRSGSSFPYAKLPEKVRAKILALLLVNEESIIIDFVSSLIASRYNPFTHREEILLWAELRPWHVLSRLYWSKFLLGCSHPDAQLFQCVETLYLDNATDLINRHGFVLL